MLIDFLFWLPLWLLAIVLNTWLIGFGLVGFWIMRRYVQPRLRLGYDDAYYAAALVQSAMLLYGLVAALTAVGVWQRHSQVADVVSNEATVLASIWRDVGGYPQPTRDAARNVLRGYTEQIIHDAWPKQRRGEVPRDGVKWMDRLQAEIFAFEPATEGQKVLHAETVRSFNQLVQARRQRLDAVQAGLPSVFWFVLLPGAMGCIALCLLFHVPNPWFQGALIAGVSGFLAMVLFVIIALDQPFSGGGMAITAESYQLVYDHHMR